MSEYESTSVAAACAERVGVHGLLRANEAADRIEGDKQFRILGGYDGLVEWLAGRATIQGTVIHLNTIAEEIRWKPKQVEVTSKTKDTTTRFAAARALVTLPLGVLQARTRELGAVQFVPPLSQEKQDAIRHLAMGDVLRITLRFRKRFWEELKLSTDVGQEKLADLSFISSDLAFPTWWTQLPVRAPVMVGWVGGPRAEELVSRDDEFIRDQAVLSLTAILGITAREMRDLFQSCHMHNWHTDPFARGAYSYVPVNGLQAQLSLCRPLDGTLFFAGEATCVDGHVGTVHGAMASGKRAASEILASF